MTLWRICAVLQGLISIGATFVPGARVESATIAFFAFCFLAEVAGIREALEQRK